MTFLSQSEFFHDQKEKVKKAFISPSGSPETNNALLETTDSSDDEEDSIDEEY